MRHVLIALALVAALLVAACAGQAIDDFQPRSGPKTGQTLVTVYGKGLPNTGATRLRFLAGAERVDTPVTYINDNTLIATTPRFNETGDHDVSITFDGTTYYAFEGEFLVYSNTFQDSFVPLSGPVSGGSEVLFFGSFVNTGEIRVLFDIFNEEYVYHDAVYVDQFTLRLVTKRFPKPGKYDVSIALNGQQYEAFSEFWISYDQDLLDYFEPTSGPVSGGTRVRIVGAGFSDTGEHTVRLTDTAGEREVVVADYVNSGELVFTTPRFARSGAHSVEVAQNGQDYEPMEGAFAALSD